MQPESRQQKLRELFIYRCLLSGCLLFYLIFLCVFIYATCCLECKLNLDLANMASCKSFEALGILAPKQWECTLARRQAGAWSISAILLELHHKNEMSQ